MLLVLDNRDSFTFNLVQAFLSLGVEVVVRRAAELDLDAVRRLHPERVVVGPGPGRPEHAGCSLAVARELARELPLLGVCLGHQAIGAAFGGRVVRSADLAHGQTRTVHHDGRGLFRGLPDAFAATRYNSLAIDGASVPACLEVSARTAAGEVMGLRHREHPCEGVQFHPEAILSENGLELLANFLRL